MSDPMSLPGTVLERYVRCVVSRPLAVVMAVVVAVLLAASGGRFLKFSTDYRAFFSPDNPQLNAFERLQNTFNKNDNILFLILPRDGQVFTPRTLSAIEWLTKASWQIPHSLRVDSVTNFQHTRGQGDDLVVRDLVENAAQRSLGELAAVRDIAVHEPLLVHRLISPQADATAVNVTIQLPEENQDTAVPEAMTTARDLAQRVRTMYPELQVEITGIVAMNNAFSEAAQHDSATLVPLMFLVIVATLFLLLRSVWATVASTLVILFTIAAAMGLAGWFGIVLTSASINAPTITITLAVADCVHILITYLYYLGHGLDRHAAMARSLAVNFYAVFLTSFTTAVGFLGMNFSEVPPFRDLGNIVAIGVGLAWLFSITFLPAVMMWLPVRPPAAERPSQTIMLAFTDFVVRWRNALLIGMAAFTVLFGAGLLRNELNDEFVKYFDESVDFRRASDLAVERLTGIYTIEYALESGIPGGVSDPVFLRKTEAFAQWLRQQPEILHVSSITDTFKRLNRNLHGDDPSWYRVPEDRALAAQYLLLYEMSLPYGLDLNNTLNVKKSATRLTATLRNVSSNQLLAVEARSRDWRAAHFQEVAEVEGVSPAIMFSHIGRRNIQGMLKGNLLALVVISLSLVVLFRSFRIGLTSMIPNLVPVLVAFGVWGFLVGRIGLGLSVVTSLTMGVVVDDTIHFLSKYLHARRDLGYDPVKAIHYAFSTVGFALWVLSLVLIAGFLVLTLSDFRINAEMGAMTAGTFALGIMVEFLLVPPLLLWLERKHVIEEKAS